MKQHKILFIQHLNSSFIRQDAELLRQDHQVEVYQLKNNKGIKIVLEGLRQLLFLTKNLYKFDLVFIWFADFHAVLPALFCRLLGKKCVVVIGGVDASYLPNYNYGTKTKALGRISLFLTTLWVHQLLPVSQFTAEALWRNAGSRLRKKSKVIYNCFSGQHHPKVNAGRENVVITVCLANKENTLYIKGVDFFMEVAKAMPETQFKVVGLSGAALRWVKDKAPSNLEILSPVSHIEMQALLAKSRVICQFSRHEAFGLALVEGIAAGCFPVGYHYGGTKEILANSQALTIDQLDVAAAQKAIEKAMHVNEETIKAIQQSVLDKFSCSKRKEKLNQVLDELLNLTKNS